MNSAMTNPGRSGPRPDLLVIVPTRGRPANAVALREAWVATSTGAADLLFAVDDDDPFLAQYQSVFSSMPGVKVRVGPRLRLVGSLNEVAVRRAGQYRFVGFMGDDHRPRTPGWDARFVECLSRGTGIVYGNDLLRGEDLPTAVAMTSDIVRALGYMVPPPLVHLFADDVWRDWGRALGRLIYLPDVIIEHCHPGASKAEWDAGYAEANSTDRLTGDAWAYAAYKDGRYSGDVAALRALL